MKGDEKVIDFLNEALKNELTAINQYWLHYRMLDNWGVARLAKFEREESIDEMKHADQLIAHILYLEGLPNLQRLGKVNIGQTVPEQLTLDRDVEVHARKQLNGFIEECRALGDHTTRELLEKILISEEQHLDWLETQLELIKQVGEANYLAQQIRDA